MRAPLPTLLALTSLSVAGCGGESGPVAPSKDIYEHALALGTFRIHQTTVLPIEGFSGVNPCTGEETSIAGQAVIRTNGWGDEGGVLHLEETTVVSGTGVGVTTGARYDLSESFHHSFNSPSDEAVHGTLTEHDVVRVRAHGGAADYIVQAVFHFAVTGNGELTIEVGKNGATCRG